MYTQYLALIAGALAPAVRGSCMHGTSLHPRAEGGAVEIANFGYTGNLGPQNWASISAENLECSTGTNQSPINIEEVDVQAQILGASSTSNSTSNSTAGGLSIDFPSVESAEFENLGSTIEVIVNGTTTLGGAEFALQQFHFHTPSEHRIGEEYFPLEMHMVHESASGDLAVISVLFQLSSTEKTDLLTAVTENIDNIATPGTVTETAALDFTALSTHLTTTPLFQYTGSLTTPPCAEGLKFLVTQEPMPIDVETFNAIKKTVKFNSRYTQNNLAQANILEVGCAAAGFGGSPEALAAAKIVDEEAVAEDVVAEGNGTVKTGSLVAVPEGEQEHECIFGACTPIVVTVNV